jgi:hypothetical protein
VAEQNTVKLSWFAGKSKIFAAGLKKDKVNVAKNFAICQQKQLK